MLADQKEVIRKEYEIVKSIRKWLLAFAACAAMCLYVLPVYAVGEKETEEIPSDPRERTAIMIQLEEVEEERNRAGVEFELFHLADLKDGAFVYAEPYRECTLQPHELNDPQAVRKALEYLSPRKTDPMASAASDEKGQAVFEPKELGLFLVHTKKPGSYNRIPDFLCALPAANAQSGLMEYRIKVFAKSLPLPMVQIVKVDEANKPIRNRAFSFSASRDREGKEVRNTVDGDTAEGIAKFSLNLGEVIYIRESSAPEGYVRSNRVVKAELKEDGSLYIDDKLQSQNALRVGVSYVNEKEKKAAAPASSSKGVPTAWISGVYGKTAVFSMAFCALIGACIWRRRKMRAYRRK